MTVLNEKVVEALTSFDTPTICNALEIATGAQTSRGFTRGTLVCAYPDAKPIVGFARTATIRSAEPSADPPHAIKARRLQWYEHVAARANAPTIAVIRDLDDPPGTGAFWGEVNTTIHQGLGVQGVLTNGSARDFGTLADRFQVLAGSVSPSRAFVHLIAIGEPVEVFGLQVRDGDLLHADRHGAVLIDPQWLPELARCIELTMRRERPIIEAARKSGFGLEQLRAALQESEDTH